MTYLKNINTYLTNMLNPLLINVKYDLLYQCGRGKTHHHAVNQCGNRLDAMRKIRGYQSLFPKICYPCTLVSSRT